MAIETMHHKSIPHIISQLAQRKHATNLQRVYPAYDIFVTTINHLNRP